MKHFTFILLHTKITLCCKYNKYKVYNKINPNKSKKSQVSLVPSLTKTKTILVNWNENVSFQINEN